jgi:hypothetical protein
LGTIRMRHHVIRLEGGDKGGEQNIEYRTRNIGSSKFGLRDE